MKKSFLLFLVIFLLLFFCFTSCTIGFSGAKSNSSSTGAAETSDSAYSYGFISVDGQVINMFQNIKKVQSNKLFFLSPDYETKGDLPYTLSKSPDFDISKIAFGYDSSTLRFDFYLAGKINHKKIFYGISTYDEETTMLNVYMYYPYENVFIWITMVGEETGMAFDMSKVVTGCSYTNYQNSALVSYYLPMSFIKLKETVPIMCISGYLDTNGAPNIADKSETIEFTFSQ